MLNQRRNEAPPLEQAPPKKPDETLTKESPKAKPAELAPPTPPAEAQPVIAEEGDQADKESDASSVIDAKPEHWKLGKPLASPGLELKPRKPVFTTLQILTTAPRNPLRLFKFDRSGKPAHVELLEKSGSKEVDSAILASLYRWRASGKGLEQLKKGETIDVKIRLVLHGSK